jgi:hypothetical protein
MLRRIKWPALTAVTINVAAVIATAAGVNPDTTLTTALLGVTIGLVARDSQN